MLRDRLGESFMPDLNKEGRHELHLENARRAPPISAFETLVKRAHRDREATAMEEPQ
jgi:hypothetical protein